MLIHLLPNRRDTMVTDHILLKDIHTAAKPGQVREMLDTPKQLFGALVGLLLRHGADPRCTIYDSPSGLG
jgi:hypothetical protein